MSPPYPPGAFVLALALALAACTGSPTEPRVAGSTERPQIVTTVAPLTSIVASISGTGADVIGLVPEGSDSHTFDPPPSAARALAQADVVFLNGLALDESIGAMARENLGPGAEIVELGASTIAPEDYIFDFSFPRSAGKPNPHLWTSPPLARGYAQVAARTLTRRDPGRARVYQENDERFAAEVAELDRAMTAATATVPPERRKLLTYHDAYPYFARQYGWSVIGAIQPSSFDEPTPKEVADLIAQVRREGVPAIFGSEVFPSPVLERIGRETGARYVDVLRDDDLPGKPGDPEHSWAGMMRFNFVTMVESLGGDASALRAIRITSGAEERARYPQ